MESFVFNTFKKNLIEGKYPKNDTWYFYPVNKKFTEDFADTIKYIKNHSDFELFAPLSETEQYKYSRYFDKYKTNMRQNKYVYKTMDETDIPLEPEYITEDTFDTFLKNNPNQEHLRNMFFDGGIYARPYYKVDEVDNQGNIKEKGKIVYRGFYYVKTSEELLWCANKVNGVVYDNGINIVLGDNIGVKFDDEITDVYDLDKEEIKNKFKKIRYCIGSNPAQPYNGVFFGNGFAIQNIELCTTTDIAGIIGYLGYDGIISTIHIRGYNIISNTKKINIDHLVHQGSDICVGFLCGKNNGNIDHVYIEGTVVINGFLPGIYSVTNKSDSTDNYNLDMYTYYPAYYCFDSPGNIIPYIGYFNEGVFATYSGYNGVNGWHRYWNTVENGVAKTNVTGQSCPLEWQYTCNYTINGYSLFYATNEKERLNVLWYDGNIIDQTQRALTEGSENPFYAAQASNIGLLRKPPLFAAAGSVGPLSKYRTMDIDIGDGNEIWHDLRFVSYFNQSIKLSQQNRAAYYVSPLVGVNNSNITKTQVDIDSYTSGTFVGFYGGIAGKQNKGELDGVTATVNSYDVQNRGRSYGEIVEQGEYFYKRDIYCGRQRTFDNKSNTEIIKKYYYFPQKSIKNISSLFGSCNIGSVDDKENLVLNAVNSRLRDGNQIVFRKGANEPEYDDYYLMNRFGAFAAMVEYNAANINNCWNTETEINNITRRPIRISDCAFVYNCIDETSDAVDLYTQWDVGNRTTTNYNVYGVHAPLFAEVKPTFLSVPSIISTFFNNAGYEVKHDETTTFYRVGLFGIDQNIAAPYTDPYFYCVDYEVDLPGVGNRFGTWENNYLGAAGGVSDLLNSPTAGNFTMDLCYMPAKLIYQLPGTKIFANYNDMDRFNWTALPEAALQGYYTNGEYSTDTYYALSADLDMNTFTAPSEKVFKFIGSAGVPDTALSVSRNGELFSYNGNKRKNQFAYFGSDLKLDIPLLSQPDDRSDLPVLTSNVWVTYRLFNPLYVNAPAKIYGITDAGHHLGNNVKYIDLKINTSITGYAPFTNTPFPGTSENMSAYMQVSACLCTDNGANVFDGKFGNTDGVWKECNYGSLLKWFSNRSGMIADLKQILNTDIDDVSGFYVYTDRTADAGDCDFLTYALIFNPLPYGMDNNYPNPPYQRFQGIYIIGGDSDSHEGQKYKGMVPKKDGSDVDMYLCEQNVVSSNECSIVDPPPARWENLSIKGTFRNALFGAKNDGTVSFTNITNENELFSTTSAILVTGYNSYTKDAITENIKHSTTAEGRENTFFKYTYVKSDFSDLNTPFEVNVLYDHEDFSYNLGTESGYKSGFWYRLPECSAGIKEYNDDVHYYGNVLAIGKTLNQDSILNGCLAGSNKQYTVSAFSADDFEGILVEDSFNRPVMYIDVGLGECNDGTTWSLDSYPSINSAAYISGWYAANKRKYPSKREEEIIELAKEACQEHINSACSGLLLEVGLNGQ